MPSNHTDIRPAMPTAALFAPVAGQPDAATSIDPLIVKQAIVWMVTLQSGAASETDRRACAAWISAAPAHERAWLRLTTLGEDMRNGCQNVTPPLMRSVLRGADGANRRVVLKSLLGIGIVGAGYMAAREQPLWQTLAADYRAATGEQRHIVLADGTRVMLNTATAIDVRFDANVRKIILYGGEIMVTTAPDSAGRPFEVATSNGHIRPIGTRFTVAHDIPGRSRSSGTSASAVAVMQGAVDVTAADGGPAVRLQAGQQTRFTALGVLPPYALDNALTAWTDGMLVVERMRLADFIAELARYRKGILRCDPAVADLLVSGAWAVRDSDAVLGLLTETLPLQIRTVTRYWTNVQALGTS